uniref:Vomeronasal type-1 receptor n=1 Tax=Suricata suricatta TaxID=37032 RepID=A0A673TFA2_SURSU
AKWAPGTHTVPRKSCSLTGPGTGGNFLLFASRVSIFVTGPEKQPIDLILIHLAFTNTMTLGCKTVFYLERVARGVSICTTGLLSVVQTVTISPRTSSWRKRKPQAACQVLPSLLFFWIFNSLISSNLLHYSTAVQSTSGSRTAPYVGYCHMLPSGLAVRWLSWLSWLWGTSSVRAPWAGPADTRLSVRVSITSLCSTFRAPGFREIPARKQEPRGGALVLLTCFLLFYRSAFIFSFWAGSSLTKDCRVLSIKLFLTCGHARLSPVLLSLSRTPHPHPQAGTFIRQDISRS